MRLIKAIQSTAAFENLLRLNRLCTNRSAYDAQGDWNSYLIRIR